MADYRHKAALPCKITGLITTCIFITINIYSRKIRIIPALFIIEDLIGNTLVL